MESFLQEAEQKELFRQTQKSRGESIFRTSGSTGSNPKRLSQLISIFDFNMNVLGWDKLVTEEVIENGKKKKRIVNEPILLTAIVTANQASIDGKYHKDYKDIAIAEEIEKKRANRNATSIIPQQ